MPRRPAPAADRPDRRGLALLAAALVVYALLRTARFGYTEVPALVGFGYLAGAVAGGRAGALWSPALVLLGWGLGNIALYSATLEDLKVPESAAHMAGIGVGVLALAGLERVGVAFSAAGIALAMVSSGVLFTVQRGQGLALFNREDGAAAYGLLLAAFGLVELARAGLRRRTGRR